MSDSELRDFLREFIVSLRELGLGWVLRQVVSDSDEMEDDEIESALLESQTPRLNLLVILNALEIVLVETVKMESEIREFFMSESEVEIGDQNVLDIAPSDTVILINELAGPQRLQASSQIKNILDQLKGLINE